MSKRIILLKDKDLFLELVIKAGYSFRSLARTAECSQTTISLISKGERNPSPKLAINICNVLKCQFDDIFFIEKDYKSNLRRRR